MFSIANFWGGPKCLHITYIEIMILAGHRPYGRLGAYPGTINENSRHQTYATEKLLNVKKKRKKSYIF